MSAELDMEIAPTASGSLGDDNQIVIFGQLGFLRTESKLYVRLLIPSRGRNNVSLAHDRARKNRWQNQRRRRLELAAPVKP